VSFACSQFAASLSQARHNLRITRSLLPRSAWEEVNQLFLWATDTRMEALDRRTRLVWTNDVIRRCHLLAGLVADTMLHDDCYSFLEVGRFVERADMTTRVLDVQARILVRHGEGKLQPYANVSWIGVLRSLDAAQVLVGFHGASGLWVDRVGLTASSLSVALQSN